MAASTDKSKLLRQDSAGVVTSQTKKPLLSLFNHVSECTYNSHYCEENVWKLCEDVSVRYPQELHRCKVVFVSNDSRTVPLWRQKAGKDEEKLVVWDYHVVFMYQPDERCLVFDMDSDLPFPTHFHKYVTETFRTDHILKPNYFRYFRVLSAAEFMATFSSDRRHMLRKDGTWIKPPPAYPPIKTSASTNNLEDFINMDPTANKPGIVYNLTQLVKTFYVPAKQ